MASESIALECPRIPAASLKAVRTKLPMMVLRETCIASLEWLVCTWGVVIEKTSFDFHENKKICGTKSVPQI